MEHQWQKSILWNSLGNKNSVKHNTHRINQNPANLVKIVLNLSFPIDTQPLQKVITPPSSPNCYGLHYVVFFSNLCWSLRQIEILLCLCIQRNGLWDAFVSFCYYLSDATGTNASQHTWYTTQSTQSSFTTELGWRAVTRVCLDKSKESKVFVHPLRNCSLSCIVQYCIDVLESLPVRLM